MIEIIFNNVLPYIIIAIGFFLLFWFYKKNIQMVIYTKQKNNKVSKLSKLLHKYYNLFFILLFLISLLSFVAIYFIHSYKIEKRFDNAIQSYEKSMSNIFYNLSVSTNNQTNESIVSSNETSSISVSTMDRISINNNNIMNVISSEGDSFDLLKKSFEIGLDLLKASLSETMKNSNDVLTFWFAFLSIIMVVFSFAGYFINNNILEQSKEQLTIVENRAKKLIKNIKEKNDTQIKASNLFNLGIQAANNTDYQIAEKYFLEVINLDKNNAIANNSMGFIKYKLSLYEEAIKYFDKAIELDQYYYVAYNNKGLCQHSLKNYEEAIKYYEKSIKLNPSYYDAYYNIGNLKNDLKKYEESIKYYDKAINLNPRHKQAYNNRGDTKNILGLYEDAIKDFNKSIELDPKNEKYYNNRGNAKLHNKKYKEAIEDFNNAITLNPSYSIAYCNIGIASYSLGLYDKVLDSCNKAIELNHNFKEAYLYRYIAKLVLLEKITDRNSLKYKEYFNDVYNDLDTAYNLFDDNFKEIIKNMIIGMSILENEVAERFCKNKKLDIKDYIIKFDKYINKLALLKKISDKNSEEYKRSFGDVYKELDSLYNLTDDKVKETVKNQIIGMNILGDEVAIKFCKDKGWDIK